METEIYKRYFEIDFERSAGDRKIIATLSTEFPADMNGYKEILDHSPSAIDLSRAPLPLLKSHKHDETPSGRIDDVQIINRALKGMLVFSNSERGKELRRDVEEGFARFMSISYVVLEKTKPDPTGTYRVTRWQPLEASVVSIPADPHAVIGRAFKTTSHGDVMDRVDNKMKEYGMIKTSEKDLQKVDRLFNNEDWSSFGEFAQVVAQAGRDLNLHELLDKRLQINRAASGLNEQVQSEGGHLAPVGFSEKILFSKWVSPLIKKLLSLRVEQNRVSLPYAISTNRANGLSDGLQVFQVEHASEITASFPKIAAVQPAMKKTEVLSKVTDETLQDVNLLERFLTFIMSKGLSWDLERQLVSGKGHNEWLGLINAPAKIRVSKQGGQDSGTLLAENIENMVCRLLPESHNSNTTMWIANQSTLPQLMGLTKTIGAAGSASPLFKFKSGSEEFNTLAGFPVVISEHAQTLGTEGDLILTDLSYYLFVQKSIRKEISSHLYFLTDESAFRLVLRSDGMPILSKPITPKNGGSTCSSIITLETRS